MWLRKLFILIITACVFSSCKNQDSKGESIEVDSTEVEEPLVDDYENEEDKRLIDRVENFLLTDYLDERDLRSISKDQRKFQVSQVDLNNNGQKEIFINLTSSYFCGTGGCTVLLLDPQFNLITEFTVTRTPIYVEDNTQNGWKILKVNSEGKWRNLIFENGSYPSNPSVEETAKQEPSTKSEVLFDADHRQNKIYTF